MKAVKHINSEHVLAIDIETVRIEEHYADLSDDWKSAWEYKNKQEGVVPSYEELEKLWVKKASLSAEFSKICAVSVVYLSKGTLKCKNYVSADERTILKELGKDVGLFQKSNPSYTLVGHASIFFDYQFICKRYLINDLDIPAMFDESGSKPWDKKLLCTNELWKSFGAFNSPGSSLQALCTAFGIEISKVDLVGDEVGKAYFNGELVRIADYCNLDTIATFNVFRKFKRESTFRFDEVVYVNQGQVLEPVPFLTEIHKTKTLTDAHKKAITEFCEELTGSETEDVKKILEAALVDAKGNLSPAINQFLQDL